MSQSETRAALSETANHPPSRCRTLVALGSGTKTPDRARAPRPSSAFVAHLIATAAQAPQTRAQRRAAPEEVARRYRAALTKAPNAAGRALVVTVG